MFFTLFGYKKMMGRVINNWGRQKVTDAYSEQLAELYTENCLNINGVELNSN